MALGAMLEELKRQCKNSSVDETEALRTIEKVLAYLVLPENNTDANCKKVDLFVTLELDPWVDPDRPEFALDVPDRLRDILNQMHTLHDTHTAPEIAKDFGGTPEQLLESTRQALRRAD